jgi:hypothetical protein
MTHRLTLLSLRFSFLRAALPVFFSLAFTIPVHAAEVGTLSFNRDIRPILSDNCFHCHGPDPEKRKGKLRLDTERDAKSALSGHHAIDPAQPDRSTLLERIASTDPDEQMPPPDSGRRLSAEQIRVLNTWIRQGAPWQEHWAFVAPAPPRVPPTSRPSWVRNSVDAFVLHRLEREGLSPSAEAPPALLYRRVCLDLTGLPPTLADADAFLADPTADAYSRAVERLLESPHFGEHLAARWLNAARYADTSGYQSDGERSMWRWRDWVIEQFNRNTPFDRMTIEQLAGDLLPNATRDQRIATGFNRNHRGNAEGGIVPEEYAAEYVADRVDTTATVWMGLTLGCARCHDHKYDPISQRDFYALFALFNNVPENGRAIKVGNSPPFLAAPTPEQESKEKELRARVEELSLRLQTAEPEILEKQHVWETSGAPAPSNWSPLHSPALSVELPHLLAKNATPFRIHGRPETIRPEGRSATYLDGASYVEIPHIGDFGFMDRFTLSAWIRPSSNEGTLFSRTLETDDVSQETAENEGYAVRLQDGHLLVSLTKRWLDDALRVRTVAPIPLNRWSHVCISYDGSRVAQGVRIYVDGAVQAQDTLLDLLNQTFRNTNPFRIGTGGGPATRFRGSIRGVLVHADTVSDSEVLQIACAESPQQIAAIPPSQRSTTQNAAIRACFLETGAAAAIRKNVTLLRDLNRELRNLVAEFPTVMVMEEMSPPRQTRILLRGEYDRPGDPVEPAVPAFLPQLPRDARTDRLAFARWLVSEANPLTRRVIVNQFWQMLFGNGLVRTPEDFGSQGEPPSHPELLDWLACEFERSGWDIKHLLRTLVNSSTYRQSSAFTPELLSRDPSNRLLTRGPRFRLSAEAVRDQALAASGLLVPAVGGPSVKPYQPDGLWKELSGAEYIRDHGDKLWRRSLYTFWKRTSTPPVLSSFDAPGRETCAVRVSRTNTPLQALAVMNETSFLEAARRLAERATREAPSSSDATLTHLFRLVLTRTPGPRELDILRENFIHQQARFSAEPAAAARFLSVGEAPRVTSLTDPDLAALTAVANLVLNLDEALTKP